MSDRRKPVLDALDHSADQLIGERCTERLGDQLEQLEVDDEHGRGLLATVRGQDGLIDAIIEQHVVAKSGGVIDQRQELLIGPDL